MVPIDANYDFFTNSAGGCSSIIFMQNTFVVDAQNAKQIVNAAKKLDQ
jgi:hypothetical protein